jgi:DNA-binding NtrC family response regulator
MRILVLDGETPRSALMAVIGGIPEAEVVTAAGDAVDTWADVVVLGPAVADRPRGHEVLVALRARRPELPVLVVSERAGVRAAVAAMRHGAADYVVLHADASELAAALGRLARDVSGRERRPPAPAVPGALAGLVGTSPAMAAVRDLIRTAARAEVPVLIEGETGTGKEVVARAVHDLGPRAAGPFVPVNCAAVPETLAESEFFGHVRGAFTGAHGERPGVLQLAERGTLFLDEVEDLSPALQAKLLRVVQDREVRPLGASTTRRVDVRLVAASNRDLWQMVEAGAFRRDLYYRLRVLAIRLPPLRQRREDLPLLIDHFVARFNRAHGTAHRSPGPRLLRPLLEHVWSGNVRELENTIEALLIQATAAGVGLGDALLAQAPGPGRLEDERARILRVLDEHRWNRQRAAAALGISRVTLWRRMERHGIRDPLGGSARESA